MRWRGATSSGQEDGPAGTKQRRPRGGEETPDRWDRSGSGRKEGERPWAAAHVRGRLARAGPGRRCGPGEKREERRGLRGKGELGRRGPCGSEERKGPRGKEGRAALGRAKEERAGRLLDFFPFRKREQAGCWTSFLSPSFLLFFSPLKPFKQTM
jgi:hypothetical protein